MALVIVEKGRKNDNQKWAGSCRKCGSKAECIRLDLTHYIYDPRNSLGKNAQNAVPGVLQVMAAC